MIKAIPTGNQLQLTSFTSKLLAIILGLRGLSNNVEDEIPKVWSDMAASRFG
jgi:hypothetical protein